MLTADLVRARRQGERLVLGEWRGRQRERAVSIADELLAIAREQVGEPRGALLEALRSVSLAPREHKLADGLKKLLLDHAEFESEGEVDPAELRERVFTRASAARSALGPGDTFDREVVLAAVAAEVGLAPTELERRLYADLREAHRMLSLAPLTAAGLVELYDLGQAQAVLLRAERVVVDVTCRSPAAYRALFRKLKFLRLLHTIESRPGGGYRITVDGPYSLFASVTKYGLKLALLVPALRACETFTLRADVRWGKAKDWLLFELEGKAPTPKPPKPKAAKTTKARKGTKGSRVGGDGGNGGSGESAEGRAVGADDEAAQLPEEVATLLAAFRRREGPWEAAPNTDILDLPGVGTCIPDLAFTHRDTGEVIYFEVLGFWSRDAVWKRVELVEAGFPHAIVFAVPRRLRVSEAVLEEPLPAALYVYKGKLGTGQVEDRLNTLAGRRLKA